MYLRLCSNSLTPRDGVNGKNIVPARSILHLLAPSYDIAQFILCPNNTPVVITTQPTAFAFDISLGEWTVIVHNPGHPQSIREEIIGDGALAGFEREVAALALTTNGAARNESGMSGDEIAANKLARIEIRINAAKLLASRVEYRAHVVEYAKSLSNTNHATELVNDLISGRRETKE